MYAEFHVENDVYKYSFIKHKLNKDPDCIKILKETNEYISSDLKDRIDKKLTNP